MLLVVGLLVGTGCRFSERERGDRVTPSPVNVVDRDDPCETLTPLDADELRRIAEQIRESRKPATPPPRQYNVLVLSGGGIYGAYSAGVLVGWTSAGDRPNFDVITGVSTGALVAAVTFMGSDYDWLLRELYTTVTNKDIFVVRQPVRSLFSDALVDNTPMAKRLREIVNKETLGRVAAEHAKGRRLYIGTTNLPTRRHVVWDMGAIASRNTAESEKLFEDIMLASAAVPGFFPPVYIDVNVDGQQYEEMHVDGGVSRSMFFRAPHIPTGQREGFGPSSLHGSNLYIVVAGKLYADSARIRRKSLAIAGNAITSLLYADARGDLDRLFNYSLLTGINYKLTAIPPEFIASTDGLKFDPVEMTRLFEEGYQQSLQRSAWQDHPPGLDLNEEIRARSSTNLTRTGEPEQPIERNSAEGRGRNLKAPIPPRPGRGEK